MAKTAVMDRAMQVFGGMGLLSQDTPLVYLFTAARISAAARGWVG
jgi:hypothetical protein